MVRVSRIRAPGKDAYVRLRGKVAVAVAWRCSKLSSSSFAYSARLFVQYRRAGTTMSQHAGTVPRYSYSLQTLRKTSRNVALPSRRRATTATWTRDYSTQRRLRRARERQRDTGHGMESKRGGLATGYWNSRHGTMRLQLQRLLLVSLLRGTHTMHHGKVGVLARRALHSRRGEGSTLRKRRRLCHNEGRELCRREGRCHREGRGLCF